MKGVLCQNYVLNCAMQNLQWFLQAIKFFCKEIRTYIEIPEKKRNRYTKTENEASNRTDITKQ